MYSARLHTRLRTRPYVSALAVLLTVGVLVVLAATTGPWRAESESVGGPVTPIRQSAPDAPEALWVGDSYTIGVGAEGPARGYPCLVSDALGWTCQLDAQSGTGFVNAGHRTNEAYVPLGERLGRTAEAFGPDLVVVDAGRNDRDAAIGPFREAVASYLDRARGAFPDARLVVVLPFLLGDTGADYGRIGGVLRNAAASVDADVVDTSTPAWNRMVSRLPTVDAIHPTASSHAAIARRLIGEFERMHVLDQR
ncbi:SGNH/GDSL hydrolase family protein [Solicola gregarius]|uniref:SGNH/GDSL hydrolase family protein n=1 Tax=Solicola gregarius TaxID=2908642 RepID=A0AA46TIH3_9ACTN|nr:SGNH/GDSL hydrolase family protein [Solicola gregarius]UYM05949.1 SGNH/GDSL hydrolase family protein [Solicola gregarius]